MISIGAVYRQTGIAAETLRKWEERYGFPVPERSPNGHRQFHDTDVQALLEISRRLSAGERPGKAIAAVRSDPVNSKSLPTPACNQAPKSSVEQALAFLAADELTAFEGFIESQLTAHGIQKFTQDFAFPLIEAVGELWQQGALPMYAEHAFSSALQRVVFRHSIPGVAGASSTPLILFASPAGEIHTLALILGNALFCNAGVANVLLLGGLPTAEIAAAARSYGARVVALSASFAYPPRLLKLELMALRQLLPAQVAIWLGGAGANRIAGFVAGIDIMTSWDEALQKFNRYLNPLELPSAAHPENING